MQMEKLTKRRDMELMKMAMLKHEETFRQQVHELHRLYRIQRQLMSELSPPRQRRKQPRRRMLNLQLPADEYIVRVGEEDAMPLPELELTLAVGGRGDRSKNEGEGDTDTTPFASDYSGASLSSSSTESEGAVLHVPYPRSMAFDLGKGLKQSPWLVQCQYLSLRMT